MVADLSQVLAGPSVAMTLADLGADVIKVERRDGGDITRNWSPPSIDLEGRAMATYFAGINRNKRAMVADLDDLDDRALVHELCSRADVVIENFRPGARSDFSLDYETLAARNPRLVQCTIAGFPGTGTGPGAYDLVLQAMSGLMDITGRVEDPPTKVGVAVIDQLAGLHATVGVLAALRARERTGRGQHITVSLFGAGLSALANQASAHLNTGAVPRRVGSRHPSIAPYQSFRAADGWFVVAAGTDAQFAALARAVRRPALASDDRFSTNTARVANVAEMDCELTALFIEKSVAEWVEQLSDAGVPCGPVLDIAGAFAEADRLGYEARVVHDRAGATIVTVANPIELSLTPVSYRLPPPRLGEHDAELRAWLRGDR